MKVTRQLQPMQAIVGLTLIAIFWPLNWLLLGNRTAYLFFPLWFGYILLIDGLVLKRTHTSLFTRSKKDFALLFLISAPAWWIFELINRRTQNWEYLGANNFTNLEYYLLCTLSFSTVMPAVFETAELVGSFPRSQRFAFRRPIQTTPSLILNLFLAGLILLTLTLLWPKYCYPFVWISLALLLEAINNRLGHPSFLSHIEHGDWRPVIILPIAALICGFFWELWNFYSYPKWIYHTPGAQFAHLFEMPLLGYGGYLPFAWELYGLRNLLLPSNNQLKI